MDVPNCNDHTELTVSPYICYWEEPVNEVPVPGTLGLVLCAMVALFIRRRVAGK